MKNVFLKKLSNLVRGEDGVALVVTLALFMIMYVSCAGVFAIGQFVKEKTILQNAADAAAYSAAIVQADTLSRIAVLNREMAWAYKDMTSRQMDYIVCKWYLDACEKSHDSNYKQCKDISLGGNSIYSLDSKNQLYITLWTVDGNRTDSPSYGEVSSVKIFAEELAGKIAADASHIQSLNSAIEDIISDYYGTARTVVEDVLEANLPDYHREKCFWNARIESPGVWSETLGGGEANEERFLGFGNFSTSDFGETKWFPVDGGSLQHRCASGGFFHSAWRYKILSGLSTMDIPVPDYPYDHVSKLAGDETVKRAAARPRVLKKSYFDDDGVRRGAISVCVAKFSRNPWMRFARTGLDGKNRGLYEAFQPLTGESGDEGALDWTFAVASAQAGCIDVGAEESDRAYAVDWTGEANAESWNLRSDNFDAVYVPVRQSFTAEGFKEWMLDESEWKSLSGTSGSFAYSSASKSVPLPNMHNSGSTSASLEWDRILDKIYH